MVIYFYKAEVFKRQMLQPVDGFFRLQLSLGYRLEDFLEFMVCQFDLSNT